jgi:hypothetical protein
VIPKGSAAPIRRRDCQPTAALRRRDLIARFEASKRLARKLGTSIGQSLTVFSRSSPIHRILSKAHPHRRQRVRAPIFMSKSLVRAKMFSIGAKGIPAA